MPPCLIYDVYAYMCMEKVKKHFPGRNAECTVPLNQPTTDSIYRPVENERINLPTL